MAIVQTFRQSIAVTTGATSYATTGTYTPAANSLLIVYVNNSIAASPLKPTTVTGHGVSFSEKTVSANTLGTTTICSLWVADAGASPSTAAVTADFNGVNQTGCTVTEIEVTGADLTGGALAAIVQAVTNSGTSNNVTETDLLAAAGHADNRAIAFWSHLANEAATGTVGNWTEVFDANYGSPNTGVMAQCATSTFDRSPQASWTTSSAYRVIAAEIKAAVSGGTAKPWLHYQQMRRAA